MARQPAARSDKRISRRILVNIRRDMTEVTPRIIFEHEKPLLEELHGEGNIKDVDPATMDEGYNPKPRADMLPYNKTMDLVARPSVSMGLGFVFIGDANVEFQRLEAAFGKHPKENVSVVEKVYGRFQDGRFAALLGIPDMDDLPEAQLRSLVLDYGYAPEPHKDAGPEEKNEAWAKRKALATMGHAELAKVAQDLGVELG